MQFFLEFSLTSWFGSGSVFVAIRNLLAMNTISVSNFSANRLRGLDNILSEIGIARFRNFGGGGLGGADFL